MPKGFLFLFIQARHVFGVSDAQPLECFKTDMILTHDFLVIFYNQCGSVIFDTCHASISVHHVLDEYMGQTLKCLCFISCRPMLGWCQGFSSGNCEGNR